MNCVFLYDYDIISPCSVVPIFNRRPYHGVKLVEQLRPISVSRQWFPCSSSYNGEEFPRQETSLSSWYDIPPTDDMKRFINNNNFTPPTSTVDVKKENSPNGGSIDGDNNFRKQQPSVVVGSNVDEAAVKITRPYGSFGCYNCNGNNDECRCRHFNRMIFRPSYARITHILDMDGFTLNGIFLCKELSLIEICTGMLHYERFRLNRTYEQLSTQEKNVANFVSHKIHGIPFVDTSEDIYGQEMIAARLLTFLSKGTHSLNGIVVGYKGGNLEASLLESMGIVHFNLELIGCPKFDALMTDPRYEFLKSAVVPRDRCSDITCNLHTIARHEPSQVYHCCREEVTMFRRWYLRVYLDL